MRLGKLDLPSHAVSVRQGMATWRNPINKFFVVALHYTADPEKQSRAWLDQAHQGYDDASFDQEFELDFSTWIGRPVFGSFSRTLHIASDPLLFDPYLVMERWWDIGNHACVWAQFNQKDLRVSIFNSVQVIGTFPREETRYRDHEVECSGLGVFIDKVKLLSSAMYPGASKWNDVVDPAAFNDTIKHEGNPAMVFRSRGLQPLPGLTQNIDVRISAVEDWLTWMSDGKPAIQIDPRATILIDGFAGGYHFAMDGISPIPNKRSPFSHPCDAVEYGFTRIPSPKPGSRLAALQRQALSKQMDPANVDFGPHHKTPLGNGKRQKENWLSY